MRLEAATPEVPTWDTGNLVVAAAPPPRRDPVPVTVETECHGRRMVVVTAGGWMFDVRGWGEPYWVTDVSGRQRLVIRTCDEADWYSSQSPAAGEDPSTDAWFVTGPNGTPMVYLERPEA